jgi:hypothetical protein
MTFRSRLGALITVAVVGGTFTILAVSAVSAQNPPYTPHTERLIPSLDGATLYQTYCAVCHGKTADGDGPTASVLKAHVPNLTEIAKRNGGVFPFARVQKIIDGTESAGLRHGTREMPIWGRSSREWQMTGTMDQISREHPKVELWLVHLRSRTIPCSTRLTGLRPGSVSSA